MRRRRLGEAISRFLTDLDPGMQTILKWRRQWRSRSEGKPPRRARRVLVDMSLVATILALANNFAPWLLPWHW